MTCTIIYIITNIAESIIRIFTIKNRGYWTSFDTGWNITTWGKSSVWNKYNWRVAGTPYKIFWFCPHFDINRACTSKWERNVLLSYCPRRETQQNDNGETNTKAVLDRECWTRAYLSFSIFLIFLMISLITFSASALFKCQYLENNGKIFLKAKHVLDVHNVW